MGDVSARRALRDLERWLGEHDPLLLEAADEVDVSLLRWALALTPLERLRVCSRSTRALDGLARASDDG